MIKPGFVVALTLFASQAHAVDFSSAIRDLDGKPTPMCSAKTPECEKPVTLAWLATTALLQSAPDESDPRTGQLTVTATEKVERFTLAQAINSCKPGAFPTPNLSPDCKNGDLHLKAEDITKLKTLIGKDFAPLAVARSYEILDPPK